MVADARGRRRDAADGIPASRSSNGSRSPACCRRCASKAWQAEFAKYQPIPQYRELNRGMSLDEFKTIYWWEWRHRLLARLVGAAFLLPFLLFLWRGWIEPGLRLRLWTLFGAGRAARRGRLVDGVVGSRRARERVAVPPGVPSDARLRHLAAICCGPRSGSSRATRSDMPPRIRSDCAGLVVLVLVQIYLGALVAGLDAGLIYNTWPLIDGALVPAAVAAVLRAALVAQSLREHADGAVQSSHDGLRDLRAGDLACH